MGDKKEALRELKRAREAGVNSSKLAQFVKTNPKLAPLADDPKYQELIADAPANRAVHQ